MHFHLTIQWCDLRLFLQRMRLFDTEQVAEVDFWVNIMGDLAFVEEA